MGEVSTIGLDIAKSVFQIHGVDSAGAVVVRKRITRAKLLGRRILVRWEYHTQNFLGFVQLACLVLLFRRF
jgi:hypothetical protein